MRRLVRTRGNDRSAGGRAHAHARDTPPSLSRETFLRGPIFKFDSSLARHQPGFSRSINDAAMKVPSRLLAR